MDIDRPIFADEFDENDTVLGLVLDGFQFIYERYANPKNLLMARVGLWSPENMLHSDDFDSVRLRLNNGSEIVAESNGHSFDRPLVDDSGENYSVTLVVKSSHDDDAEVQVDEVNVHDFIKTLVRELDRLVMDHSTPVGTLRKNQAKRELAGIRKVFTNFFDSDRRVRQRNRRNKIRTKEKEEKLKAKNLLGK